MPVRSRRAAARSFPRLENELSLVRWIAREFGYDSARELREDTKRAGDGFDSSGRSLVGLRLLSRGDRLRITEDDLVRYDDNIRSHLAGMNAGRAGEPITLRYFQHLAALASEHFLRRRAESRPSLRASLNESLTEERSRGGRRVSRLPDFEDADLDTLAFWMATGSGKTLLLHLNYRQFLHYHRGPLDNILLVTPNEGLSAQHLREARLSGIPMRRFDAPASLDGAASVRVIEITKLAGEKRGGGVTVPVEAFEGKNLVFVDEGHKGSGGEAWRKVRDALAQTGFTFEYSATFGQALAAAKDQELTSRYGKAVLFDYSYRWFYEDGYGKDFRVLNLESDEGGDVADALLVGSLLAFHEQRLLFSAGEHSRYRIASPLWVFVGGTVNAVYTRGRAGPERCPDGVPVLPSVPERPRLGRKRRSGRSWAARSVRPSAPPPIRSRASFRTCDPWEAQTPPGCTTTSWSACSGRPRAADSSFGPFGAATARSGCGPQEPPTISASCMSAITAGSSSWRSAGSLAWSAPRTSPASRCSTPSTTAVRR